MIGDLPIDGLTINEIRLMSAGLRHAQTGQRRPIAPQRQANRQAPND